MYSKIFLLDNDQKETQMLMESMPHLKLDYSANIEVTADHLKMLFSRLHQVLVQYAGAELNRCQSRAVCCENFYVGDGGENRAFVHLQALLLEGRTPGQLQETGSELLKVLQEGFKDLLARYHVQISVHVNEIPADRSFKSNHFPMDLKGRG
jgi:5-carboxymethyl-2-hydroxymuconate isomerase